MVIFRNDDVSSTSDFCKLVNMYRLIHKYYPEAEIWSCVNLFAKSNERGSVYPDLPLKEKPKIYFYDVDSSWANIDTELLECKNHKVVSHGILHTNHAQMSGDAQEFSIVTSCNYLKTKLFCAPYSGFNQATLDICNKHGIKFIDPKEWKSLESEPFDPSHEKWFFHSWRFTLEEFEKCVQGQLIATEKS